MHHILTSRTSMTIPTQIRTSARTQLCGKRRSMPSIRRDKQLGIVLITVALFLVVLAALGAASMRSASVQERIAGVFYDRTVALTAADAAISDSMEFLLDPNFDSSSASSKVRDGTALFSTTADGLSIQSWVASNFDWLSGTSVLRLGAADGITDPLRRVKANFGPSYVVDRFPNTGITTTTTYQVFRITARGNGGRAESSSYAHVLTRIPTTSGN